MRNPTVLTGLLLAASLQADPILVTLENASPGGVGPVTFTFDMDRQASSPHDFPDIAQFEGDFIDKEDEYRINVADYFHVEREGWTGYGYNWLLERWPSGLGIFEQYCQVQFFSGNGQVLILQGAWSSFWSEDTPLGLSLETPQGIQFADMRIADIGPVPPPIPEPGTMPMVALGLAGLAGLAFRARNRRA